MKKLLIYSSLFFITISIIAVILLKNNKELIESMFSPVSIVSSVASTVTNIKETDGRTNFLLVGHDSRSTNIDSVGLTDTLIVLSVDNSGKNAVAISIPRDLWVEDTRSKVNAVFSLSRSKNGVAIPESERFENQITVLKKVVGNIVGMPIHYYGIVGFEAFVQAVDAVDGITINIPVAFDDYEYPIAGKEDAEPISARYEHLRFSAGEQNLDGITALKYARSRHSTNPQEAGDFNRARRQQLVIVAVKDKILSTGTLANPVKLTELYNAYKDNVKTDFNIAEMPVFYDRYKSISDDNIYSIVLSNETKSPDILGSGLLKSPNAEERAQFYNGQYVLVPYDLTYNEVHALIREKAFSN